MLLITISMNVSVPMVPSKYPLLGCWQFKMLAVGTLVTVYEYNRPPCIRINPEL